MRKMRAYTKVFAVSAENASTTARDAYASAILISTQYLLIASVYSFAYAHSSFRLPISFEVAIWSLGAFELMWGTGARYLFLDIREHVSSGSIETFLLRPISYPLYTIAWRLGRNGAKYYLTLLATITIAYAFAGPPPIASLGPWVASFAFLFTLGVALTLLISLTAGIASFWMTDSRPVFWMMDKAQMILGGTFLPVAFFPPTLRAIAEWSPFGASLSYAQTFFPDFSLRAPWLFASSILWLALFTAFAAWLWTQAKKKIVVFGG